MKERVRQIREHFHLSQRELAKDMEVTPGFISLIENGRSGMSDDHMEKISKTYHLRAAWLRDGVGPMESEDPADWTLTGNVQEEAGASPVSKRISALRKSLHLNQREFGAGIGYSREAVALVEQGRREPTAKMLREIEKVYRVNLGEETGEVSESAREVELETDRWTEPKTKPELNEDPSQEPISGKEAMDDGKTIPWLSEEEKDVLDRKLAELKPKLNRAKEQYDALMDGYRKLWEKRHPGRQQEYIKETLYQAYLHSQRSLEEVLIYLAVPDVKDRFNSNVEDWD